MNGEPKTAKESVCIYLLCLIKIQLASLWSLFYCCYSFYLTTDNIIFLDSY